MIYAVFSSLSLIIRQQFKHQRVMRHFVQSDQLISPNQGKISNQNIESIPPGSQKMKIGGLCTIKVEIEYVNTLRQSPALRCKLWGMEGQGLIFDAVSEKERVLNLNVRSTLENVSNYFKDMKGLCLEVMHSLTKQRSGSLEKKKLTTQYKQIGWIFLSPQRYIINHIFNNFEESVSIIDMKKQKIGEAKVKMSINMCPQAREQAIAHQNLPAITRPPSLTTIDQHNLINKAGDVSPISKLNNLDNVKDGSIGDEEKYQAKGKIEQIDSGRQNVIDYQNRRDFLPEFRRKGRAQQFLDEYHKNKPEHTELSLIRDKYGFNNPSVQVMKLKYDEVRLLCKNSSEEPNQDEAKMNILLKTIRIQNVKAKIDYLTIYCEGKDSPLKTETKVFLAEPVNQKYDINYLYMLPNCPTDTLTFEIKDAKAQLSVNQLAKMQKVQLKNKLNKKIAVIEFSTISNRQIEKSQEEIQQMKPTSDHQSKRQNDFQDKPVPKAKDTAYIYVLNWKDDKIALKNKNFGIISANKLLFELSDPSYNTVEVVLEGSKRQKQYLQVDLAQLFKQQNYNISGRQVKIISARGPSSQLLTLISKLEPDKNHAETSKFQRAEEKQVTDHLENIKGLVSIFQNFAASQNVECNELIEELLKGGEINFKRLQKLSNLINVSYADFLRILEVLFDSSFEVFFQHFQTFHQWNHRYQSIQRKTKRIFDHQYIKKLLKMAKKLNKSNQVLFGVINSAIVIGQFCKQEEAESMGRLVVVLTERYFNRSIKLSEFEQFISQEGYLLNLNAYLLCKLSHQVTCQIDSFKENLSEKEISFLRLFELQRQFTGEEGFAKLLLTDDEQLTESQITNGQSQHTRRQTEPHQGLNIRTEESKEPESQKQKSFIHQESSHQLQPEKAAKRCAVILKRIETPLQQIKFIILYNQNDKIELDPKDINHPKAVSLLEHEVYRIQIEGEEMIEGVFVAIAQSQKVQLFLHNQQIGTAYFGSKQQLTEQSEIAFQLVTTHKQLKKEEEMAPFSRMKHPEELSLEDTNQQAKSPLVKMTIRSIRPSRPDFKLKISNCEQDQAKYLTYPQINETVLPNSSKGWKIHLLGEQFEGIVVPNYLTSNTYCFTHPQDQKIAYMVIIMVEECWDSDIQMASSQSLHIFVHLEKITCLQTLQSGQYQLVMQNQHELSHLTNFDHQNSSKNVALNTCVVLRKPAEELIIKVIHSRTKKQIAQFSFTITVIAEGAQRCERHLIANQSAFRLMTTVIQLRHEWSYCKPDRILSMFESANKKAIQSWVQVNPHTSERQFICWLKQHFYLTLAQIDIMLYHLVKSEKESEWKDFLKLFESKQQYSEQNIEQIQEEFNTFDIENKGLVNRSQMNFIKKTLDKNYSSIAKHLKQLQGLFITEMQKEGNFIIDLMANLDQHFDYLSFLSLFANNYRAEIKKEKRQNERTENKDKYLRVRLVSFSRLKVNEKPSTILFKVNDILLAEPIPRCYSHNYPYSETVTLQNKQPLQLEIFCQQLSSEGKKQYKLIQTVPLQKQIKILGGTITFQMSTSNEANELGEKLVNPHELSPIERQNQQEEPQLNDSRFQKSFWNKSLQQTKQRWTRLNDQTDPSRKRKLCDLIDDDELARKKKELFDKEWE